VEIPYILLFRMTGASSIPQEFPAFCAAAGVVPVNPSASSNYDAEKAAFDLNANGIARTGDSLWTNLSTFSGHGGKLIFYHGMSDPWFSPLDTVGYYEKMSKENGGTDKVKDWSRLFLVPGMGHCQGGTATVDSFDMLTAIVNWVENGKAMDSVTAKSRTQPGRSRPLCPYPSYAQYSGQGDPKTQKASSAGTDTSQTAHCNKADLSRAEVRPSDPLGKRATRAHSLRIPRSTPTPMLQRSG
jgi:hypothetical protein